MRIRRAHFRAALVAAAVCAVAHPADDVVVPLTVCEIMRDLPAREGKSVAVLGRYSFRESGLWVGEQACEPAINGPAQFRLVEDTKDGPKPPGSFELDGMALKKKLTDIERRTALGKFRFGTPDYDRWAVVWGRVEARKPDEDKSPVQLVYRGSGVVIFLRAEQ
jgi:hypothetical protein